MPTERSTGMNIGAFLLFVLLSVATLGGLYPIYFWVSRTEERNRLLDEILADLNRKQLIVMWRICLILSFVVVGITWLSWSAAESAPQEAALFAFGCFHLIGLYVVARFAESWLLYTERQRSNLDDL